MRARNEAALKELEQLQVYVHVVSNIVEGLDQAEKAHSLFFRVYYERPVVIDSPNLKLRQIARFSSNMILDVVC